MFYTIQSILALAGLAGVALFAMLRTCSRQQASHRPPTGHLISLFLGLSAWTVLSIIRHDVVATVGLLVAMALFHRHYQALPALHISSRQEGVLPQQDSPLKPPGSE